MSGLFAELRRRKVFRTAIGYAVVAWVVIQIADVTFEPLHLPQWALTALIAVAAAGLPLVIILSWIFDLGPSGLERDAAGSRDKTGSQAKPDDQSIAVLPFADLSPDNDQEYFCSGIVEEIINMLSRIEGLHVTSRLAALKYGRHEKSMAEIGRELNVARVLEGTVRKAGEDLRITAQLVDTSNGYHIWSKRFDRRMQDVFAIQDEIATTIAEAMELVLHPGDRCSQIQSGTTDSEAYDLYWKGWSYFHRWGSRNLRFSIELFQRAIDKDPEYARAWAGLADAYATLYIYMDARPEYRDKVREASLRALELCPKLPEAHVSRGLSCSMFARWEDAAGHFEQALSIDPEHFEALYFYARACVHEGNNSKAIELFERAAAARPEDYQSPLLLQQMYKKAGMKEQAEAAARDGIAKARRQLEMNPDDVRALYLMSGPLADIGELEQGEEVLRRAIAIDPTDSAVLYNAACFYARTGNHERAVELLEQVALPEMAADWVRNDPDLELLSGHPRFEQLYPAPSASAEAGGVDAGQSGRSTGQRSGD